MATFSVCIPNFNYARYLDPTISSARQQTFADLEILFSDNASTDASLDVVRRHQAEDPRIQVSVNRCNVGFFGNLDRAARMARGRFMLMLSSDDLMEPRALEVYERVFTALGDGADRTVIGSARHVIDGAGARVDTQSFNRKLWRGAERDAALSERAGGPVWSLEAPRLLANSLRMLRTPYYFVTTAYPRALYDEVEGYSQGGLMNPDKRFAWALLERAERALFVDLPLFRYRVHDANQLSQNRAMSALKHHVDQYTATITVSDAMLERAGMRRDEIVAAFVEQDIGLRGLRALGAGDRATARRILHMGYAAYPWKMGGSRSVLALRALLRMGPVGTGIARMAGRRALERWRRTDAEDEGTPRAWGEAQSGVVA